MSLIKVYNGVATREPVPTNIRGLALSDLRDLSFLDPALGFYGMGWWPEEILNPEIPGGYKWEGDETLVPDFDRYVVQVTMHYVPMTPEELEPYILNKWEEIKFERDRRRLGGVKVGNHWFHSDDTSRIQQMGLYLLGEDIPNNLQWKTLKLTKPAVFVEMTPQLVSDVFHAIVARDIAVFQTAEMHRQTMEVLQDPQSYDHTTGWPMSVWEDTNEVAALQSQGKTWEPSNKIVD